MVDIWVGDALKTLRPFPDNSFQMCVTSPPYFGLRDYQVKGQAGNEPTPELYVRRMVKVFREVRRVLRKGGVLFLNIGDSYATGAGTVGLVTLELGNRDAALIELSERYVGMAARRLDAKHAKHAKHSFFNLDYVRVHRGRA